MFPSRQYPPQPWQRKAEQPAGRLSHFSGDFQWQDAAQQQYQPDEDAPTANREPKMLSQPCPCCGGRMIEIGRASCRERV